MCALIHRQTDKHGILAFWLCCVASSANTPDGNNRKPSPGSAAPSLSSMSSRCYLPARLRSPCAGSSEPFFSCTCTFPPVRPRVKSSASERGIATYNAGDLQHHSATAGLAVALASRGRRGQAVPDPTVAFCSRCGSHPSGTDCVAYTLRYPSARLRLQLSETGWLFHQHVGHSPTERASAGVFSIILTSYFSRVHRRRCSR